MKVTEEKDETYTLSGLNFNQLSSIIEGVACVTERYRHYTDVQKGVYKEKIKDTNEMLYELDCFMMEGME